MHASDEYHQSFVPERDASVEGLDRSTCSGAARRVVLLHELAGRGGAMKLAIITGEASGDLHASEVVHDLRELDPDCRRSGSAATVSRAQGVELLHDIRELGIVGLFNVIRHIPMFKRVFREILEQDRGGEARRRAARRLSRLQPPPRAQRCHERGLKVVYYISPQLWAWRKGRIHEIRRNVDEMIVIFPFEEQLYRRTRSVGHLRRASAARAARERSEDRASAARTRPERFASRSCRAAAAHEIETLLPPMLDAVRRCCDDRRSRRSSYRRRRSSARRSSGGRQAAFRSPSAPASIAQAIVDADVAICASGTATLETGDHRRAVVVVYRLTTLSYGLRGVS